MPRYLVEQHVRDGLSSFISATPVAEMVATNHTYGVVWLLSYVTENAQLIYSVCEAESPEAIRKAAQRVGIPIEAIHRVTTWEPHPFTGPPATQS